MSNTGKKAETAENTAEIAVQVPVKAPIKYSVSRLRKDCFALYGVSTSTFDGANVGIADDSEYTVEEMGERIKKWQDTPVNSKNKKEDK